MAPKAKSVSKPSEVTPAEAARRKLQSQLDKMKNTKKATPKSKPQAKSKAKAKAKAVKDSLGSGVFWKTKGGRSVETRRIVSSIYNDRAVLSGTVSTTMTLPTDKPVDFRTHAYMDPSNPGAAAPSTNGVPAMGLVMYNVGSDLYFETSALCQGDKKNHLGQFPLNVASEIRPNPGLVLGDPVIEPVSVSLHLSGNFEAVGVEDPQGLTLNQMFGHSKALRANKSGVINIPFTNRSWVQDVSDSTSYGFAVRPSLSSFQTSTAFGSANFVLTFNYRIGYTKRREGTGTCPALSDTLTKSQPGFLSGAYHDRDSGATARYGIDSSGFVTPLARFEEGGDVDRVGPTVGGHSASAGAVGSDVMPDSLPDSRRLQAAWEEEQALLSSSSKLDGVSRGNVGSATRRWEVPQLHTAHGAGKGSVDAGTVTLMRSSKEAGTSVGNDEIMNRLSVVVSCFDDVVSHVDERIASLDDKLATIMEAQTASLGEVVPDRPPDMRRDPSISDITDFVGCILVSAGKITSSKFATVPAEIAAGIVGPQKLGPSTFRAISYMRQHGLKASLQRAFQRRSVSCLSDVDAVSGLERELYVPSSLEMEEFGLSTDMAEVSAMNAMEGPIVDVSTSEGLRMRVGNQVYSAQGESFTPYDVTASEEAADLIAGAEEAVEGLGIAGDAEALCAAALLPVEGAAATLVTGVGSVAAVWLGMKAVSWACDKLGQLVYSHEHHDGSSVQDVVSHVRVSGKPWASKELMLNGKLVTHRELVDAQFLLGLRKQHSRDLNHLLMAERGSPSSHSYVGYYKVGLDKVRVCASDIGQVVKLVTHVSFNLDDGVEESAPVVLDPSLIVKAYFVDTSRWVDQAVPGSQGDVHIANQALDGTRSLAKETFVFDVTERVRELSMTGSFTFGARFDGTFKFDTGLLETKNCRKTLVVFLASEAVPKGTEYVRLDGTSHKV